MIGKKIFAWFLLCGSLNVFGEQQQSAPLSISVGEWAPYIDSSQEGNGVASEIVTEAFARVGYKVDLVFKTWPRVEFDVDHSGEVSFGWIYNTERDKKWLFSEPLMQGRTVLAVLKGKALIWKTLQDLKPFTLATARGYSYGDEFDSFKSQLKIFENNEEFVSMKMLLNNRVDAVVIDPLVARQLLLTHFAESANRVYFVEQPPIKNYDLHLICARDNPQCPTLISRFDAQIKKMNEEGWVASAVYRHMH
ncbi:MAG: transporter substrate-binding domain-containing protein [Hahellaceae bacterium]|nr:transporter substrate-binding domain-containing protein [Hahellaceae bacterium]